MFPAGTLVTDMVVTTPWAERRTRFFWEPSVPPTTLTHLEAVGDRLMATLGPQFKQFMTTQTGVSRFECRWYGAGGASFEGNSTVAALPGNIAAVTPGSVSDSTSSSVSDTLPDEVCLIIQKRTGQTGRNKRGRWFITGLSEQIQNAGQVDLEYRAAIKSMADVLSSSVVVSTGFSSTLNARHYDRKSNVLVPITKCYALQTMGSRRDRRHPLRLSSRL